MPRFRVLTAGDPAPWFRQRSAGNPTYAFDTIAGRYVVLGFLSSSSDPAVQAAIAKILDADVFDDAHASFFGVFVDPKDETRLKERIPGFRLFWDFDGAVSRLYGGAAEDDTRVYRRHWVLLDPTLRVLATVPFGAADDGVETLIALVRKQPPPDRFAGFESIPPVLVLPNVLEPDLCRKLIDVYNADGGEDSGFMREIDGRTVLTHDHAHKRRRDCFISDPALVKTLQDKIRGRIVPEIAKVFQFRVTRMERYLIGCYAADDGGHFRAHRDNTTKGTAHRRFAVTINLNSDFDGGELSFPEYGPRAFKPPVGGAVVFSCSLLHAASRVTRGVRYAFLPFLYDDAAAEIREKNNAFLAEGIGEYRKG